jgi:hypothetical protein
MIERLPRRMCWFQDECVDGFSRSIDDSQSRGRVWCRLRKKEETKERNHFQRNYK